MTNTTSPVAPPNVDAVAVAHRVEYGLTSTILAGDTYKAFELAPQLLHGIVNVNSPTVNDGIHAPMGRGADRRGIRCVSSGLKNTSTGRMSWSA